MALHELIYASLATHEMSASDLTGLLDEARANNEKLGITGMLVYHGLEFMQLLEGDKETIFTLYDKICRDGRHHRAYKLWDGPIKERGFSAWAMGFAAPGDLALHAKPGYSDFLARGLTAASTDSTGKQFLLMLRDDFLLRKF